MASAKLIIRKTPYKDGRFPIYLQIITGRKTYLKMICAVKEEHLNRPKIEVRAKHPQSYKLNVLITRTLAEAKEYILDCQMRGEAVDPSKFMRSNRIGDDIVIHLQARINSLSLDGKDRTAAKFKTVIHKITETGLNISIHNINEAWIHKFDRAMKDRYGNKPNTRARYLKAIGSVMRLAVKTGTIQGNPFDNYRKPSNKTSRAKLSMDEFEAIQRLQLTARIATVRDMFVFATLARGMRAYDVLTLQWTNVRDGRIRYRAQKSMSKGEGREFDIMITGAMTEILGRRSRDNEYIFELVKIKYSDSGAFYKHVASKNTIANKALKVIAKLAGINKVLTMHVARGTFAYLSDQANVPPGTIQQLLGHSMLSTTLEYIQSLRNADELDKASDKVFG